MAKAGLVVFVMFALFVGTCAFAAMVTETPEGFDHYRTDVDIVADGDGNAAVTETYNFRWWGISSGEMYISFSDNKRAMVDVSSIYCEIDGVPAVWVSSYNAGVQASYAGAGLPLYTYGKNPVSYDWEINAFYPRERSGEHTVTFGYTLNDVTARYADCADLYYKVFTGFSDPLNDLTVTVTMPSGSLQDRTYIYGHGDPNGYCEFVDDETIVFKSPRLEAYTMFEIRVVSLQTGLFAGVTESNGKTFDSILAEEKRFQDETDRAIMLAKVQLVIVIAMFCAGILIFIFRMKFTKRNKPTFDKPYTRELPSVKPNISAHLAGHYRITSAKFGDKISATILNLALMKVIAIEEGKNKELVFVSLDDKLPMTRFEKSVYDMIFCALKGTYGDRVTLSQMKKALRKNPTESSQLYTWDEHEFDNEGFVDSTLTKRNKKWRILSAAACFPIVAVIAISVIIMVNDYILLGMLAVFINFGLAVLASARAPAALNILGEDEYARTMALKRFYTDMTLMKERQTMELALWERHLVYATAIGVSKKVIKELEVRLAGMSTGVNVTFIHALHSTGGISKNIASIGKAPYAAFARSGTSGGGSGGYSRGGGGGFSGGGGGGHGGGGGGHR
ncbi:MAG: DUF2207 domain-containing protein [Methanomassiliicoccaceae archaeon]|nr:DUF2207 domain-containing protein [Methanomassiliicoccaceae archaeon]